MGDICKIHRRLPFHRGHPPILRMVILLVMAGLPPVPAGLIPHCLAGEVAGRGAPSEAVNRWLDEQRIHAWDGDPAYLALVRQTRISDAWVVYDRVPLSSGIFGKDGKDDGVPDPVPRPRPALTYPMKFDLRVEAQNRYDLLMAMVDRYNASAKTISGKKYESQLALMEGRISWEIFNRKRLEISTEMAALFDGPSVYVKAIDTALEFPWISRREPKEYPSLDKINDGFGASMNALGGWRSFMDREQKARKARF